MLYFPMFILGLMGMPRRYYDYLPQFYDGNVISTIGSWIMISGLINTIILLISSATVAMSITAIQKGDKRLSLYMVGSTILLALVFLINKYFEWGSKFEHGMYPGSDLMDMLSNGEMLFFSLYFFMTGLHGVHIIVGMVLLAVTWFKIKKDAVRRDKYALLENSGLYWHLVDLIWIFLFPLFYLIT